MKKKILYSIILALFLPTLGHAAKIGFVDFARAITVVEEGKAAKNNLQKDFNVKQKKLDALQDELKNLKEAIEASMDSQVITDAAKQKQQREFQEKLVTLQRLYVTLQQDLSKAEAEAMKGIVAKMRKIIAELGQRDKYEFILDSPNILYGPNHMDLTNEVIRLYNKKHPYKGK